MKQLQPHRSSVGHMPANLVSVLCYLLVLIFWVFGLVPVLIFFLLEKKSALVRFHAMQAMLLWALRSLLGGDIYFEGLAAVMTGNVRYLENPMGWGGDISVIVTRVAIAGLIVALLVLCAVNAYYWRVWRVPLLGQLAQFICKHSAPMAYTGNGPVPPDMLMDRRQPVQAEAPPASTRPPAARTANGGGGKALAATGAIDIAELMAGLNAAGAEAADDHPDAAPPPGAEAIDDRPDAATPAGAEAIDARPDDAMPAEAATEAAGVEAIDAHPDDATPSEAGAETAQDAAEPETAQPLDNTPDDTPGDEKGPDAPPDTDAAEHQTPPEDVDADADSPAAEDAAQPAKSSGAGKPAAKAAQGGGKGGSGKKRKSKGKGRKAKGKDAPKGKS